MDFSKAPLRYWRYAVGALLFVGIVSGLKECKQEHRPFAKVDEWYTGSPIESGLEWEDLEADRVYSVSREASPSVAQLLVEEHYGPLDYEAANKISEKPIPRVPGLRPVLVRAVQVSRYLHTQTAKRSGNALWVQSVTISRWPLPMLKRPAIVLLKQLPEHLHVDAKVFEKKTAAN